MEVLGAVAVIVAEDTRRTRALLSHLEIRSKRLVALEAHASPEAVAHVVERLLGGDDVALVTDAGTPAVSDPGRALVAAAAERGIAVCAVPGPSAVTAAVALSALVEGPFTFLGFLPRSGGARKTQIERIARSSVPSVLFEAPQRMAETLGDLAAQIPERRAFVGRELTKLHEESLRGTLCELSALEREWRGEIVVVIAAGDAPATPDAERRELVLACLRAGLAAGASASRMARALAEVSGLSRRELYAEALLAGAEESSDPSSDDG